VTGNDFAGKLHKYFSVNNKWTDSLTPEGRKLAQLVSRTICTQANSLTDSALRLWLKYCAAILYCIATFCYKALITWCDGMRPAASDVVRLTSGWFLQKYRVVCELSD